MAAPVFVQSQINHTTVSTGTTVAFTWTGNTTTGNTIVVVAACSAAATTVSGITDSQSNVYVRATGNATGTPNLEIWYAKNITGGTTPTVTVTFGATGTFTAGGYEYSGLDATAPFDAASSATGSSASPNSGAASTNSRYEVVVGAAVNTAAVSTYTAGVGFGHLLNDHGTAAGTNAWLGMEDKVVSSIGLYSATLTQTSGAWTCCVATFKAADQTGPFIPNRLRPHALSPGIAR